MGLFSLVGAGEEVGEDNNITMKQKSMASYDNSYFKMLLSTYYVVG